jgi:hypothetical protein
MDLGAIDDGTMDASEMGPEETAQLSAASRIRWGRVMVPCC